MSTEDDTDLCDYIVFGGMQSPGVATITSGFEREESLDVKESDGQKGASTTWKGTKCGGGTISFYLIRNDEVDEFALWDDFAAIIESTVPPLSGKAPVAKDVYHPDLARNKYTSLIKRKMSNAKHDGKGGRTYVVDFAEYYPPKPAKAGGASGSKSKGYGDDQVKSKIDELNGLLNEGKTP